VFTGPAGDWTDTALLKIYVLAGMRDSLYSMLHRKHSIDLQEGVRVLKSGEVRHASFDSAAYDCTIRDGILGLRCFTPVAVWQKKP